MPALSRATRVVMACLLVFAATRLVAGPFPGLGFHLGETVIYLTVLTLGPASGAAAAGIGTAAAAWAWQPAPWGAFLTGINRVPTTLGYGLPRVLAAAAVALLVALLEGFHGKALHRQAPAGPAGAARPGPPGHHAARGAGAGELR